MDSSNLNFQQENGKKRGRLPANERPATTINAVAVTPSSSGARKDGRISWGAGLRETLPTGVKFRPTEEVLAGCYLKNKVENKPLPGENIIHEAKLYDFNPNQLADCYMPHSEDEWYFFTSRERKYPKGYRPTRSAGDGYWKPTGKDKPIMYEGSVVAYKKVLDFYEGHHPRGVKTDWKMHEYRVDQKGSTSPEDTTENPMQLDKWVLCKLYINTRAAKKKDEGGDDISVKNEDQEEENVQVQAEEEAQVAGATDEYLNNIIIPPSNSTISIGAQQNYAYSTNPFQNTTSSSTSILGNNDHYILPAAAARGLLLPGEDYYSHLLPNQYDNQDPSLLNSPIPPLPQNDISESSMAPTNTNYNYNYNHNYDNSVPPNGMPAGDNLMLPACQSCSSQNQIDDATLHQQQYQHLNNIRPIRPLNQFTNYGQTRYQIVADEEAHVNTYGYRTLVNNCPNDIAHPESFGLLASVSQQPRWEAHSESSELQAIMTQQPRREAHVGSPQLLAMINEQPRREAHFESSELHALMNQQPRREAHFESPQFQAMMNQQPNKEAQFDHKPDTEAHSDSSDLYAILNQMLHREAYSRPTLAPQEPQIPDRQQLNRKVNSDNRKPACG